MKRFLLAGVVVLTVISGTLAAELPQASAATRHAGTKCTHYSIHSRRCHRAVDDYTQPGPGPTIVHHF